jgi:two-component system sensor histidine kinase BarA
MKNWSIKSRMVLLTLLPTLTVTVLLGGYFIHGRLITMDENLKYAGQSIIEQLSAEVSIDLYHHDTQDLQEKINNALIRYDTVLSVSTFSADGELLATSGDRPGINSQELASLSNPKSDNVIVLE